MSDKIVPMLLPLWLGALSLLVLGLTALTVGSAYKARQHRMATDRRLDELGRALHDKADALNVRCDDLRQGLNQLSRLEDRLRLLELENELARLRQDGQLAAEAETRLNEAVRALRADLLAAKEA